MLERSWIYLNISKECIYQNCFLKNEEKKEEKKMKKKVNCRIIIYCDLFLKSNLFFSTYTFEKTLFTRRVRKQSILQKWKDLLVPHFILFLLHFSSVFPQCIVFYFVDGGGVHYYWFSLSWYSLVAKFLSCSWYGLSHLPCWCIIWYDLVFFPIAFQHIHELKIVHLLIFILFIVTMMLLATTQQLYPHRLYLPSPTSTRHA